MSKTGKFLAGEFLVVAEGTHSISLRLGLLANAEMQFTHTCVPCGFVNRIKNFYWLFQNKTNRKIQLKHPRRWKKSFLHRPALE